MKQDKSGSPGRHDGDRGTVDSAGRPGRFWWFEAVKKTENAAGWVFYPLTESGPFVNSSLMFYQRVFAKPMLNGAVSNSDGEALRRTVHSPYNKATPGVLARFGLTNMVFFEQPVEGPLANAPDASLLPPGYQQIASFKGNEQFGKARIYKVTASQPRSYRSTSERYPSHIRSEAETTSCWLTGQG